MAEKKLEKKASNLFLLANLGYIKKSAMRGDNKVVWDITLFITVMMAK